MLNQALNVRRQEFKYFVRDADLNILRNSLTGLMKLDNYSNSNTKKYTVTSLYFDTHTNSALNEKLDGILEREKYRIRVYDNNNSTIKLERKKKIGTVIFKESHRINLGQAEEVIKGDYSSIKDMEEIFHTMKFNSLIPKVIVEYDREAYYLPWGNIRITFDTNLRTYNHNIDVFNAKESASTSIFLDNLQILEIKFSSDLPEYIRNAIEEIPTVRSSISKFVLCQKYSDHALYRDPLTETF